MLSISTQFLITKKKGAHFLLFASPLFLVSFVGALWEYPPYMSGGDAARACRWALETGKIFEEMLEVLHPPFLSYHMAQVFTTSHPSHIIKSIPVHPLCLSFIS